MTTAADTAPTFPATRGCPYAPPAAYTKAREDSTPQRVTIWNGSRPWLVARHEHVQQVLRDARFSADVTGPGFPNTSAAQPRVEGGLFFRKNGAEHMDTRRLLNPAFTTKRVERWRDRISALVDETIDRMLAMGGPVDAQANFALVVPTVVICEILGVDQSESHIVHEAGKLIVDLTAPTEQKVAASEALKELLRRYAELKRDKPDDALLSTLVNTHVAAGTLTMADAVRLGALVIGAGHETTSNMLGLGVLALIRDPEQRARLLADPQRVAPTCVEEMLRYWTIVQTEPRRVAIEDVEIGGVTIKAGEGVVCALGAANRDPRIFDHPEELDVTRTNRTHMAFGFGVHQCLGQNLSRVELQIAWPRLFQRIPDLRLAVPEQELRFLDTHLTYGLRELPVTWGTAA